jgi:CDP-glucose 4,6-dehydratase
LQLGEQLYNNSSLNGENFNFGPQAEYAHTVQEILEKMSIRWNFKDPKDAYRITDDIKFHEAGLLKLNCDKALFYFHWLPTLDYQTLIEFTSDWYYIFYKNKPDMFAFTLTQILGYEQLAIKKGLEWTK